MSSALASEARRPEEDEVEPGSGLEAEGAPTGQAENFIEAEEPFDDGDSAVGDDDGASYTTSLKSVVTDYIEENKRRYHAARGSTYFLPNDEAELDRLDLFHHCLTLRAGGKLHLAPIDPTPERILDLGTGTGIWAIEMGDKYPDTRVLGNDISAVQPEFVPPNVSFEIDDFELPWAYSSKFDLIHGRYLAGSVRNWPRLIQQAYKFLKPGGYIEMQDFDMHFYTTHGEFKPGCPLDKWARAVASGVSAFGMDPHPGPQLKGWMQDAGFVAVKDNLLPMPLGPWPKDRRLKEVGTLDLMQFLDGLEGISLRAFTHTHKWEPEEVKVFLALVRREMLNVKMQVQHNYHIVYGQKPWDAKD
ncbi:S-adenosyl-L-methionine-dependent methyltransferase [Trichodelitschia bisporula]|uniref:S-adenosyl-L-methionine-dependent methyltransferase n=1 Tax=Trichodelitschia bisporula TaxID=703511 RepID=A0A6G1I7B7_9PEZI|nr:S-adenosyl-L-methionine-dependent methyltransferase [Trichodelitschia bisporula]